MGNAGGVESSEIHRLPVVDERPEQASDAWVAGLVPLPSVAERFGRSIDGAAGPIAAADSPWAERTSFASHVEEDLALKHDADLQQDGDSAVPAEVWDGFISWWKKIDIYGQIRVRQETDFARINQPTRNRQRVRIRLGADIQLVPEVKVGARMTTGDRKVILDPDERGGAPLSYQDLGDVFDKVSFNLDRIYFALTPDWLPETTVWLGKFLIPVELNPIFAGPVGDLTWDEAAQIEGAAAARVWPHVLGMERIRWAGGIAPVLQLGDMDDAGLYYTQLWAERRLDTEWLLSGGVTYFHWMNLNPDGNTFISSLINAGNEVVPNGPGPLDVVFASKFRIINPLVALTYGRKESTAGLKPTRAVGEAFINTGSFREDRDFGYTVGIEYGSAIFGREQHDWLIYYTWSEIEQESVFTPVGQDDFLRATNFRGHMTGVVYFLWKDIRARLAFLSAKPIIPIQGSKETEWRGRVDLTANW